MRPLGNGAHVAATRGLTLFGSRTCVCVSYPDAVAQRERFADTEVVLEISAGREVRVAHVRITDAPRVARRLSRRESSEIGEV